MCRFQTAFVRAGSFLENFLGGIAGAEATGVLYTMYSPTDRAVPMIATQDIGKEIAGLLTDGWSGKTRIVELGSSLTPDEVAVALSEVLGKDVAAQAIPRERLSGVLQSFGVPADKTWAYEEMVDGVNSGWIDFGVAGTDAVAGTTTPAEVFSSARQA